MQGRYSREDLLTMYRLMRLGRRFDERAGELHVAGKIYGGIHQGIGQEAVSVGVCSALHPEDLISASHRGHIAGLCRGLDPRLLLAEMAGKRGGCCKGKGGSMHYVSIEKGIFPASGIVGEQIGQAAGVALACKIRNTKQVMVTFFGDGASNQGLFHEALNMASIWCLPVVFICENNLYSVTTHVNYACAVENIADRAVAYNMPGFSVDGMDVIAVADAAREAVDRARSGGGPTLIECKTYRMRGHFTDEEALALEEYRLKGELEEWEKRDCLSLFTKRLKKDSMATSADLRSIDKEVEDEIKAAEQFMEESAYPEPSEFFDDVYAVPYPGIPVKGYLEL